MKITLTKGDIMRLICKECNVKTIELIGGEVLPEKDNIYWEGNPDEEMVNREAAKEPKKK